jgi:MscS family membrane protein
MMLGISFYSGPPISVVFAYTLVGGIAFARLFSDLAGPGWRTQRVYGLIAFLLLTRLFYMLNLATPFLRLYILVAALLSLIWCLHWATKLASGRNAPRSAWGLGMTAAFFLIVVCMELWGGDALGGFLFTSALRTLILLPGFRLLQHLIQGGVEWAVNTSFLHAISLVRRNAGGITQRLSRLVELLVGVLLVTDLLVVWGVYASPSQALAAILGWSLSSGAQPMTVGDGVAAVGVVYVAVLVSWLVQQLLLDETLTTRDMERATRQAVARLVHYSLILVGFILALIVLGVDLTKVTLLASALGIGVGLAAKDLLASFFGGLMIYLDRPFAEGDWIRSPDRELEGTVEQIGVRLTRIRTFDQRPLYVPNSIFSTTVIENPSRMWNRRIYETIGIRYDDIDKMAGIVHDVEQMLRAHPEIDTTRTLMVNFTTFAASSLDFFIYTFTKTTNWQQYHKVKQDVLLRIAEIIAAHGAEIAFPTSTVYVPNGLFVQPDVAERR